MATDKNPLSELTHDFDPYPADLPEFMLPDELVEAAEEYVNIREESDSMHWDQEYSDSWH